MARKNDIGSAAAALLQALDCAFDRRSWHGPNLLGALRGVTPELASQRVAGRKTVWEQLLHAAYWKHRVLYKLSGDDAAPFPRKAVNWPPMPAPANVRQWRRDIAMLRGLQRRLREVVAALPPQRLDGRTTWLIQGAAAHDLYHAGQIKLLRRILAA
jgi:hypothetical protein